MMADDKTAGASQALLDCIWNEDTEGINKALSGGADINITQPDGATPLFAAAETGQTDVVTMLVLLGADVNKARHDGTAPLYIAAQNGHMPIVAHLISKGANVNLARHTGATPLFIAAQKSDVGVVTELISTTADVNQARHDDSTALFIATQKGHMPIVTSLISAGADLNLTLQDGATPLFIAAQNGHTAIVRHVISAGADMNCSRIDGVTPLVISAELGQMEVVSAFVSAGADVNLACLKGATPLFKAAETGRIEIARELLNKGALVNSARADGVSPLHIAVQNGNTELVQVLISFGADVNIASRNGTTPLLSAMAKHRSDEDITTRLITATANLNMTPCDGESPLCGDKSGSQEDIIKMLISVGADINQRTVGGYTPFNDACIMKWLHCMKLLYNAGTRIDTVSDAGVTALHYFCYRLGNFRRCRLDNMYTTVIPWIDKLEGCGPNNLSQHHVSPLDILLITGTPTVTGPVIEYWLSQYGSSIKLDKMLYATIPVAELDKCVDESKSLHTTMSALFCFPGLKIKVLYDLVKSVEQAHISNFLDQSLLHMLAFENTMSLEDMEPRIRLLVDNGEPHDGTDVNGMTAMDLAVKQKNESFLDAIKGQRHINTSIIFRKACDTCSKCAIDDGASMKESNLTYSRDVARICGMLLTITNEPNEMPRINYQLAHSLLFSADVGLTINDDDNMAIVNDITELIETLCLEISQPGDIFTCIPILCGSVREGTKCGGRLAELDFILNLVKFCEYFGVTMHISAQSTTVSLENTPTRENSSGLGSPHSSTQLCAQFWLRVMSCINCSSTRAVLEKHHITIKDCKRKNGFAGNLQVTWHNFPIVVDIVPAVLTGDFVCLLESRRCDDKMLGRLITQGMDISSIPRDLELLLSLPLAARDGYCLAKILSSLPQRVKMSNGDSITGEKLISSFLLKSSLFWLLDPQQKLSHMYPSLRYKRTLWNDYTAVKKHFSCLSFPSEATVLTCTQCEYAQDKDETTIHVRSPHAHGPLAMTSKERGVSSGVFSSLSVSKDKNLKCATANNPPDTTNNTWPDIAHASPMDRARDARLWARGIFWVARAILEGDIMRNYHLCDQEIPCRDQQVAAQLCGKFVDMLENS